MIVGNLITSMLRLLQRSVDRKSLVAAIYYYCSFAHVCYDAIERLFLRGLTLALRT